MSDGNTNIVGANSLNRLGFALFDDIRQSENAAHRVNEMDLGYDEEWEGLMKKYPRLNFVSDVEERKKAFLADDQLAIFPVNENPFATDEMPWSELPALSTVGKYDGAINAAARIKGIDPDILRAIMYMETTHGYYDHCANRLYENLALRGEEIEGLGRMMYPGLKSYQPMNINHEYWGAAFGSRNQLKDPLYNILVAAEFIRRLSRFAGAPSDIERIATLYNLLGARRISNYGKRVGRIYRERLWEHPERAPKMHDMRHIILNALVRDYCAP